MCNIDLFNQEISRAVELVYIVRITINELHLTGDISDRDYNLIMHATSNILKQHEDGLYD